MSTIPLFLHCFVSFLGFVIVSISRSVSCDVMLILCGMSVVNELLVVCVGHNA